jgi:pyruvate dehydrogenase (quinone)
MNTVSDFIVKRLSEWGIKRIYGYPGDGINGLMGALLKRKEDRTWRSRIEKNIEECWKVLEARAMNEAEPINPQRVFWELSKLLPENCILTADTGSTASWFSRDIRIRRGMMASLNR